MAAKERSRAGRRGGGVGGSAVASVDARSSSSRRPLLLTPIAPSTNRRAGHPLALARAPALSSAHTPALSLALAVPRARARAPIARLLGLVPLLLSVACQTNPDLRPEGDAGDAARPEDLVCPAGLPGAELVRVQTKDGVVFCMDQREVTWAEYDAFLEAKKGDTSGQPPECDWNRGYEPEYYVPNDINRSSTKCEEQYRPVSKDSAANCLDFCDAFAYCAWAGKRLCGAAGAKAGDGGMAYYEELGVDITTPATEFGWVCTQGGTTKYPYGDEFVAENCPYYASAVNDGGSPPEVANVEGRTCHGTKAPFDQVYDLYGNLSEWNNLCRTTEIPERQPTFSCVIGGGIGSSPPECSLNIGTTYAAKKTPSIGLRCCADGARAPAPTP